MKEEVKIVVQGIHKDPHTKEKQTSKISTDGRCKMRGLVHYVQYVEEEEEGVTTTTLRVEPQKFVMTKKGSLNTTMEFLPGAKTHTLYQTPYGPLSLEIDTHNLAIEQESDKLHISLQYLLLSDGIALSENELNISIKECS